MQYILYKKLWCFENVISCNSELFMARKYTYVRLLYNDPLYCNTRVTIILMLQSALTLSPVAINKFIFNCTFCCSDTMVRCVHERDAIVTCVHERDAMARSVHERDAMVICTHERDAIVTYVHARDAMVRRVHARDAMSRCVRA